MIQLKKLMDLMEVVVIVVETMTLVIFFLL